MSLLRNQSPFLGIWWLYARHVDEISHLTTPLEKSSRSSSIRLVSSQVKPKKVYRIRRGNKSSQVITRFNTKRFEIVEDIKYLFLDNTRHQDATRIMGSWKENLYKALDITSFQWALHALLDKYHKWLPNFQGNNVISAQTHLPCKSLWRYTYRERSWVSSQWSCHNNACLEKIGNTS